MRYELISPMNFNRTALETILANRDIPKEEMQHYLHTTDDDINDWRALGEDAIKEGIAALLLTIRSNLDAIFIVDCDCDGYTSSAILINYLYDLFPNWVLNHVIWFMHEGKEHGLEDFPVDKIDVDKVGIVVCADSASNDYAQHKLLLDEEIKVLILDHHEAPYLSEHAITINSQFRNYPNKMLSGAGVAWQFCRAMDEVFEEDKAQEYIDLCALGLLADMMSLTSIETKHLINQGLTAIKNPFFRSMVTQNSYSIGDIVTPIGVAFYVAPYINAVVRSGTLEEKQIIFKAMLKQEANKKIPSTKRGHKQDEMETIVTQAVRTAVNVKNRQKRAEDKGLEILEELIVENDMLKEPVLMFTLEKSNIEPNIRGLAANRLMAKYQRPIMVLVRTVNKDGKEVYAGSARGYKRDKIQDFRGFLEQSGLVNYAQGHKMAMGVEVSIENTENLKEYFRQVYKDALKEPTYYVDYILNDNTFKSEIIEDIGNCKMLWGQDFDESYIVLEEVEIPAENIHVLSKNNKYRVQILYKGIEIIKFNLTEEEIDFWQQIKGSIVLNILGTCTVNEWCGRTTPQLLIKDTEVLKTKKYVF